MRRIIEIGRGLNGRELGEDIVDPVTYAEWDRELVETVMIPNCPVAHWLVQEELVARVIWQQRYQSVPERQAWLEAFYQHVMNKGVYTAEVGKRAYSADAVLEKNRVIGALKILGLEEVDNVFINGPGTGW